MDPPPSPPTENAWHGRYRTQEEHRIYAEFTANVIAVNGLTPVASTSSTQASVPIANPGVVHSSQVIAPKRRGRPRKAAASVSSTSLEARQAAAPNAGTNLDRVYTLTGTGNRRRAVGLVVPRPVKRRRRMFRAGSSSALEAEWEAWAPIDGAQGFGWGNEDEWHDENAVDDVLPRTALDEAGEEVEVDVDILDNGGDPSSSGDKHDGRRQRRYQSSDDPMSVWLPLKQEFLDEILIRAGLRDGKCISCGALWAEDASTPDQDTASFDFSPPRVSTLVRCESCGDFCECMDCSRRSHENKPLHNIKVWRSAGFWERATFFELHEDLVYHIGHNGGRCAHPHATRNFTVIHTNGVHRIRAAFCDCDRCEGMSKWQQALRDGWYPATTSDPQTFATIEVLELHRLLNVCATVNVRDFVTSLEKRTNPCGTEWVPDRYKAFGLMSRQWSLLGRVRRAGLGHRKEGFASAPLGSAAVLCWACPREGVNLPDDWRQASKEDQFLFMLFVALDANFRMRSRLRKKSANKAYTIVGDGLGYQVPTESYMEHLKHYVREDDISTCIAFAALMQKDTRLSTGLRATGVGGCVCSRHELVRPLGIGDLMKGERYSSMDYIFWAAIMTVNLLWVLLSYDIGCQWKVHLLERKKGMPALLKGEESPTVRVGTPVWHAGVHEESCETSNSLRFKEGAAMTDGEGVERVWGRLGAWATPTREMHVDGRHENLEDVIDQHNFSKNLGLGTILERRYEVAVEERDELTERHEQASSTLTDELKEEWTSLVTRWHEQEDWPESERTAENPYTSKWKKDALKVADVMVSIEKEETEEARTGLGLESDGEEDADDDDARRKKKRSKRSKKSGATFIRMGLQLEQTQRRIRWMMSKRVDLTATRETKIQEQRTALFKQLKPFRNLQLKYMPTVETLLEEEDEDRDPNADPVAAENVKLYLPSDLLALEGYTCPARMKTIETRLRKAQCSEALTTLRLRLHAKSHVIKFRNNFVTGQKRGSRARTVIDTISNRVDAIAAKYQRSRAALRALVGEAGCGSFFELKPEDISMKFVVDANAKGARRLARIQGRQSRQSLQAIEDDALEAEALLDAEENTGAEQRGGSRRKLSWIWTVGGGPDGDDDEYLHESVRIEWCKSYARMRRWNEEVRLLLEEMRRVLRSLAWTANWWMARAEEAAGATLLDQGRRAYARRQAAWLGQTRGRFAGRWLKVVGSELEQSA